MNKCNCILLVDDDDISNFINHRVISTSNVTHHTHITKNGLEALEFIRRECSGDTLTPSCPDVILLDIKMPIMDGFEFLEEFESENHHLMKRIKIILLTSSSNPSDLERAKGHNISGYINKPLTSDKLSDVFEQL